MYLIWHSSQYVQLLFTFTYEITLTLGDICLRDLFPKLIAQFLESDFNNTAKRRLSRVILLAI